MPTDDVLKRCPDCGQDKPRSDFYKDRSRKDGLTVYCKECNRRRKAERMSDPEVRARYNERNRVYAREKRANDPEYAERARKACRERNRKRYREDPEFRVMQNKQHREWWQDKLENDPEYVQEYKERQAENQRRRRADPATKEKQRAWAREYRARRRQEDPEYREMLRFHERRRHALKKASGSFTRVQWEMLCDLCGNRCLSCGTVDDLTIDHIVPLSEGGSNDITNLQPLCSICNASKGTSITDYRTDEVATVIEAAYL